MLNLKPTVLKKLVFLGALAFFVAILKPNFPKQILWPDTPDYIANADYRGWLYPGFIDLVIPQAIQDKVITDRKVDSANYERLSWVQVGIALLCITFLLSEASRIFWLLPGLIAFSYLLYHFVLLRPSGLLGNIHGHAHDVVTEGLSGAWVFGLAGFSLYLARKRLPTMAAAFLGFYLFIGVEIAPRMIPFALFSLLPLAINVVQRSNEHQSLGGRDFVLSSALAPAIFALLTLGQCFFTLKQFGVFATSPFNGITTVPISIQFATGDEASLFDGPQKHYWDEVLAKRVLGDEDNVGFVNRNMWHLGHRTFKDMYGDESLPAYNRFVAPMNGKVLFAHKENVLRWLSWVWGQFESMHRVRQFYTYYHFLLLVLVMMQFLWLRSPLVLVSLFFCGIHLVNALFTVSLQGAMNRYLYTTELLTPIALAACAFALLGQRKSASIGERVRLSLSSSMAMDGKSK